jgi:hypothetical protein
MTLEDMDRILHAHAAREEVAAKHDIVYILVIIGSASASSIDEGKGDGRDAQVCIDSV